MTFTKPIAVAAALVMAAPLVAQISTGRVYGPALTSCGSFVATPPLSDTSIRTSYMLWVQGYVSGASTVLSSREAIELADTDTPGIEAWIMKYCTDNPLDSLQVASTSLVLELIARAKKP
jgi:hypothetical protein